jgi:hypothetical protein
MIILSEAKKHEQFLRPNLRDRTAATSSLQSRQSPEKGMGVAKEIDNRKRSFLTIDND